MSAKCLLKRPNSSSGPTNFQGNLNLKRAKIEKIGLKKTNLATPGTTVIGEERYSIPGCKDLDGLALSVKTAPPLTLLTSNLRSNSPFSA